MERKFRQFARPTRSSLFTLRNDLFHDSCKRHHGPAIVLGEFVITAALYRRTLQDCQITCLVALLPEILIDVVLDLVLRGRVVPAFMLRLSSMLCLPVLTLALEKCVNGWGGWNFHDVVSEKSI
jgi:hypothetical protein